MSFKIYLILNETFIRLKVEQILNNFHVEAIEEYPILKQYIT